MTTEIRLVLGRIVGRSGPAVGRASQISYSIVVQDSGVEGVYQLDNQRPLQRWSEQIDIIARTNGEIVIGTVTTQRLQWHFFEYPAFAACPNNENLAGDLPPEELERLRLLNPRFAVGTVPGGGQESTPAPSEQ